jgi:hypothetical protein
MTQTYNPSSFSLKGINSDSPRGAKFLILAAVMITMRPGWEKEEPMNATACCDGTELTYCEELCIFATEHETKTEGSETFWYSLPEGFSGP